MDLRYPIGEFKYDAPLTDDERQACLAKIEETPARMRAAVAGLNEQQLDTPYRPEGWTVRQVVHHVPESHLVSYTRFKLAIDAPPAHDTRRASGHGWRLALSGSPLSAASSWQGDLATAPPCAGRRCR